MATDSEIASLLVRLSADIEQYNREFDRATKVADKKTSDIDRYLKRAEKSFKGLGKEVANMALGFVGFTSVVAASGVVLGKMISEAAGAELANKRFAAQLNATASASGKTVNQLNALADQMKTTTMATEDEAKAAISQLLSFRSVAGDAFDETLRLAQDLAASGFGTLSENAAKLGKALEDPEKGFKALRSAGVILSDSQEQLVKSLEKAGDRLGAQKVLLDAVRDRVGGSGAAQRESLAGAWHGLTQATDDWFETLGKNSGLVSGFTSLLNGMTDAVLKATAGLDGGRGELAKLQGALENPFSSLARDPNTRARIEVLKEQIALEDQVERIRGASAKRLSDLAQVQQSSDAAAQKSGATLNEKREKWAKDEKESRAKLAAFNKLADEQDKRSHALLLEDKARAARVAADEMVNLRFDLAERLDSEEFDISLFQTPLPSDVQKWLDDQEKAAKEAADRIKAVHDEAVRDMFDSYRNLIRDLFDGDMVNSFDSALKRMGSAWKDWAANLLAEKSFDKIFGGGGAIEKVLGKDGGLIVAGLTTAVSFLAGITSRPSDKIEGVTRELFTGRRTETDLGAGKDSPENRSAVNKLDDALFKFRETLAAFGLNSGASSYMLEAGGGHHLAPFRASVSGGAIGSYQTADAAFAAVARELVKNLTGVPAELQTVVDNFDPSNIEKFTADLQRYANLQSTLADIRRDTIEGAMSAEQREIALLEETFAQIKDELRAFGFDLTEIETIEGQRRADIVAKYAEKVTGIIETVPDAVDEALARAEAAAKAAEEAYRLAEEQRAAADAMFRDIMERRIDALGDEARALQDVLQSNRSFANSIKGAKQRFLTDDSLFAGTKEQQLAQLLRTMDETAKKAMAGDVEAQGELANIALAAAEANKAFNASSVEGNKIQTRILATLDEADTYALNEIRIAERSLAANEEQVALLRQLAAAGGAPLGTGKTVTPIRQEWDTLNASFANALSAARATGGANADQKFLASPQHTAFRAAFDELVGRTTDVAYLQELGKYARSQITDPVWGDSNMRNAGVLRRRLMDLGAIPGFEGGGMTGTLARVHPGEFLYTGPPARVFNKGESNAMMGGGAAIAGLRSDIQMLARTVSIASEDQNATLMRMAGKLDRMSQDLSLAVAKK